MMQEVTRYECPFCKKLFKTPNRHRCKHDPINKNCLSCGYFDNFENFEGQFGEYGRCEIPPYVLPICAVWESANLCDYFEEEIDATCQPLWNGDGGSTSFVDLMYRRKWKLDCPGWVEKAGDRP